MIRSTLVLLLLLTVLATCSSPALATSDALAALRSSFRITGGDTSGTSFAVAMPSSDQGGRSIVLVTAAHVFSDIKQESCQLILRQRQEDGTFIRKEQTVQIGSANHPKWRKHPDLDIAALPITLPDNVAITPFSLDQLSDEPFVVSGQVQVGQVCFVPCFPAQLEANGAGWPVLRRGSVASYPLHPVAKDKTFLLDYSGFGGDSGAPVITRPIVSGENAKHALPMVVGIVIGMQRQTDKSSMPFEERTVHHPLGLGICVHAHYIRETIALLDE
jgi:hypothetical protein